MKKISIMVTSLFCAILAFAQNVATVTVTGTVTDTSGETLPGAIVTIAGSSAGTVKVSTMADIDGKYSIECAKGDVISFQYIGMKDLSVTFSGKTKIDAVLEADVAFTLDEAVCANLPDVRIKRIIGRLSLCLFCLFWLKYVEPNQDDVSFVNDIFTSDIMKAWRGVAFEHVC